MHELYQTIAAGDLKAHSAAAFEMTKNGPVVVMSRATPKAVMVSPEEWNRIAEELRRYRLLAEARRIIERNDANNSWVSGSEVREKMAKRGVHVGN